MAACCDATLDLLWDTQILGIRCSQPAVLAEIPGASDKVLVFVHAPVVQSDVPKKAEMVLVSCMRHGDCGFR